MKSLYNSSHLLQKTIILFATVTYWMAPSFAHAETLSNLPHAHKPSKPTFSTQKTKGTAHTKGTMSKMARCFFCKRGSLSSGELSRAKLYTDWIGFGAGYSVLGEYKSKGWLFTATEAVGFTLLLSGAIALGVDAQGNLAGGVTVSIIGLALYVGFRIWEVIDFGKQLSKYSMNDGKAKQRKSQVTFAVVPIVTSTGGGLGLFLKY